MAIRTRATRSARSSADPGVDASKTVLHANAHALALAHESDVEVELRHAEVEMTTDDADAGEIETSPRCPHAE